MTPKNTLIAVINKAKISGFKDTAKIKVIKKIMTMIKIVIIQTVILV